MSRNTLLGLLLLALGVAVFVRWNSQAERAARSVPPEPEPAFSEPRAPAMSPPEPREETAATDTRSPAAAAAPALAAPLEVPVHVLDRDGQPLADASVSVFEGKK